MLTRKKFIADTFVKPFFAILFCLIFGGGFIFVGNLTIPVTAVKDQNGSAVFDYAQEHFWGYLKFRHHMEGVKKAEISSRQTHHKGRHRTLTTVVLISDKEKKSLLGFDSNLGSQMKRGMVDRINSFLQDPEQKSFSETFRIRDLFYWIGLPFFILGAWGLLNWPKSIIDATLKYRKQVSGANKPGSMS